MVSEYLRWRLAYVQYSTGIVTTRDAHIPCIQEVILDMFFDLLNIRAPDWHQAFIAGRRLTSK